MTANHGAKCRRAMLAALLALASAPVVAADNPLARGTLEVAGSPPIEGAWNGADLERRANCSSSENDGSRGTYAEFDVSSDRNAHILGIDETAITGLTCSYGGTYSGAGLTLAWAGHYSCSDGKRGTFTSRSILATANALSIHLDVQLDTTETCTIEKVIGAGRLYP